MVGLIVLRHTSVQTIDNTFAIAGSVRHSLQSVQKGGEGGDGGQEMALQRVALGHQQLHQGHAHLAANIEIKSHLSTPVKV